MLTLRIIGSLAAAILLGLCATAAVGWSLVTQGVFTFGLFIALSTLSVRKDDAQ